MAYISRPRGVRGEVRAEALTHSLQRFDDLKNVVLERAGQPDLPLALERWRTDEKGLLLKFASIDSPEAAQMERGMDMETVIYGAHAHEIYEPGCGCSRTEEIRFERSVVVVEVPACWAA